MERICVVGAGVSGLGAAWALSQEPSNYHVEVFEPRDRLGGNAWTVGIPQSSGPPVPVDISVTAFIPSMYPHIVELMDRFGIEHVPTRFSYTVHYGGKTYGHDLPAGLFAEDIKKFRSLLRFLGRFNVLNNRPSLTLAALNPFNYIGMGRMLGLWRVSESFQYQALKPLFVNFVLASNVFGMPASLFSRYMDFFDIEHATPMTTWDGGTRTIYGHLAEGRTVHLGLGVTRVQRHPGGITVHDDRGGVHQFDQIIFACAADQALALLAKPTRLERWRLGAVRYDGRLHQTAVVHTDASILSEDELATRSNVIHHWGEQPDNYQITYVMHNQQPWAKRSDRPCLVTYNPKREINPAKVVATTGFRHVVSTVFHTTFLLNLFRLIQGKRRTWHCGTHTTINSQEHGLVSGLTVAHQIGAPYPFPHNREAVTWFNFYGRLMHGLRFRTAKAVNQGSRPPSKKSAVGTAP